MTAWWKLCIGGCAALLLVACQPDKNPEQTTADSTAMTASTEVTTSDTNLTQVAGTSAPQGDTGNAVTTTVTTQETNAPAATTTTTTTSASATPAPAKTTVKPVPEQPARTESAPQPAPGTKPVESAPAREPETVKPATVTTPAETAVDPKAIFLQEKCTSCHSITSAGIADKVQRDLSRIGAKHSESWITQFLQQQVELDGKKHKKLFKGTEAELKMVARWLAAMK